MAWIRTVGEYEELVFASDSRLSGGQDWDCSPKLLLLPRGDSVIGFAGDTLDAYPLMLQFRTWTETEPAARKREIDINALKKRMRLMFNDMRRFIADLPVNQTEPDPPECELLFGGWSWQRGRFCAWRFFCNPARKEFDFEPPGSGIRVGGDHPIVFAGTRGAVEKARDEIIALLKSRDRFRKGIRYFDMEPFEVLRDMIRGEEFDDVGGPPQLVKVYKNGSSQPFAVKWPMPDDRQIAVMGRPLFANEKTSLRVIDPDQINFLSQKTLSKNERKKLRAAEAEAADNALAEPAADDDE
jgi:hypothetical protein